jgi:hypothetical protein
MTRNSGSPVNTCVRLQTVIEDKNKKNTLMQPVAYGPYAAPLLE